MLAWLLDRIVPSRRRRADALEILLGLMATASVIPRARPEDGRMLVIQMADLERALKRAKLRLALRTGEVLPNS